MMRDAILKFTEQFAWAPRIENTKALKKKKRFVLLGMGGSHLAGEILQTIDPALPLIVHRDYGLPALSPTDAREMLFIASSYSGNTEETIDALRLALKKGHAVAVLATGGKLSEIAQKNRLPFVAIPNTGIQPRSALGFSLRGILALLRADAHLKASSRLTKLLKPEELENAGRALAKTLIGKVPVIYASTRNFSLAYNWKIKFNETGKIPAFYNLLPELNHNEMTGFDVAESSKALSEKFAFVMLEDRADHPRVQKRMKILSKLYADRGFYVTASPLVGKSPWEKIFQSLLLADWTAVALAEHYGLESEQVPMVEEFKKLMME